MKSRTTLFAAVALLGASIAIPATTAAAQRRRTSSNDRQYRSRIDTTIAFDKSGMVTINAGAGDVIVTAGAANQIHVRAVSDDDDIRLDATRTSIELSTARRGNDSRFEVTVPVGVRVFAKSQSGDISVRGTHGEVQVQSQSGDVKVEDVNGRLEVRSFSGEVIASNVLGDVDVATQSGDLTLSEVRGNIEVANTSGDIMMRGAASKLVRAKTTSGDVTYEGTIDPAGRYDLTSHSGDIRLRVPRDAGAQLSVSTWSGEINSDFPITLKPGEHGIGSSNAKRFTFEIGSGSARITAETFSGDVTVSSNGRGPRS